MLILSQSALAWLEGGGIAILFVDAHLIDGSWHVTIDGALYVLHGGRLHGKSNGRTLPLLPTAARVRKMSETDIGKLIANHRRTEVPLDRRVRPGHPYRGIGSELGGSPWA